MSPDEFALAKTLEDEGWEYLGLSDSGDLMFSRFHLGITFAATVREDR